MKMIKKIGVFTILLAFITFVGFQFINVKAEGEPVQMLDGASIRTEGVQGLKFSATFDQTLLNTMVEGDFRGFFIMYGVASVADLNAAAASPDPQAYLVNGKSIKRVADYDKLSETISVVLTGIPVSGYNQAITVVAFTEISGVYTFIPTVVTRSVAEVALSAAKAGDGASVSSVLAEIENNYFKVANGGFDSFGNYVIGSSLYENDPAQLKIQFISDWNTFTGSTWVDLNAATFAADAKVGSTSTTDLSGSKIYNFFHDEVIGAKWGWFLDYSLQAGITSIHSRKQARAIKGDGTDTVEYGNLVYDAEHFSYALYNFFNKSNTPSPRFPDVGNFSIMSKYDSLSSFNDCIYIDPASYSYVQLNEEIMLPSVQPKNYYTTNGYKDGSTPIAEGAYIVTGNKKLVPQYVAIPYNITYFDGSTELTLPNSTYTVEAGITLASYDKEGFVFNGWYDNPEFTGSVITTIPQGTHENKAYYAKTTASGNVAVEVTYDLNGGQLNSTDLYTLRTSDVKIVATRYSTAGDGAGARITVGTGPGGAYWYVIGLKPTGVSGIYEVVGKGKGYTNAEAALYISYHDGCTSPDKTALAAQYSTTATVGSLVVIEWLPSGVMADTVVDVYFIALSEATANVVVTLQESAPMLAPVRVGYTFNGWSENADGSGTLFTTYPGFTSSSGVTTKTYYAKWTAN